MSTEASLSGPTENFDAVIGRRVHQLMWDRQITQTDFGRRIGVDQSSLAKRLRGKRGWSTSEVKAAADELGVSVGYLFGETENVTPPNGPDAAKWAPSGSNRRPADYRAVGSLVSLEDFRERRRDIKALGGVA